jgi:hypothetical protein
VIIPAIQKNFSFNKIDRENNKTIFNILKCYAEDIKKELTDNNSANIIIDSNLIKDTN